MARYDWGMDNFPPWRVEVCRVVARWCGLSFELHTLTTGAQRRVCRCDPRHRHVFHCTPKHGSWLNQAELFFGVLPRRFFARGSLRSTKDFERCVERCVRDDNTRHAHPYRWTYTGEPLGQDTPLSRTRRQQRQGRAWFSQRPKRFERLLDAPRPYQKRVA
jgi:hypothetical protein